MRLNFFVGFRGTHSMVRSLFEDDSRVANPAISHYRGRQRERFNKMISFHSSIDPVMEFLFENHVSKECNFGLSGFGGNLEFLLSYAPPGSRVWFFTHNDEEVCKALHLEYINTKARDNWTMKKLNLTVDEIKNLDQDELIDEIYPRLDATAEKIGAGPWKPFNLSEYFEDGVDVPTDVLIRLYIKE
jgi:hypothetical protein